MPETAFTPPKPGPKKGGSQFHKPGCKCAVCVARRRKAEAESGRTGSPSDIPVPENPNLIMPHRGIGEHAKTIEQEQVLHAELTPFQATGNSARDRVAQWIYMRAAEPGITNKEVAKRLGIMVSTLNTILYRARREGWLEVEDPLSRIEVEILPKIVENVNHFLDARDRTVTIEAMKGFLVPQWKEANGIKDNEIALLGIKIEIPKELSDRPRGKISGQPRTINQLSDPTIDVEPFDE